MVHNIPRVHRVDTRYDTTNMRMSSTSEITDADLSLSSEGNQDLKILSRLFSRFLLEYILDRMHSTDRIE